MSVLTKQATNFLKTYKILLLMAQFFNATSNFANLAMRGDRHWLSEPTIWLRKMGKEVFSENWSDNDVNMNRLQDFYNIFDLHVQETK